MPWGSVRRGSKSIAIRLLTMLLAWHIFIASVCAQDSVAHDVPYATQSTSQPSPKPGVVPTLVAVGPGLVLHGAGTFVARDRTTARRILISEGVSFAAFIAGGALLAGTGASRKVVGVTLPIVTASGSIFMLGWLADIYAASTGGRDVSGAPQLAPLEAELGYRYVYDPQFEYRNFVYVQSDLRMHRFRLSPSAWLAVDDDNQRLFLDGAYRVLGRSIGRPTRDGSYLDLAMGMTMHRYPDEKFTVYTPEWRLDSRLDLGHVGPSLRGSFFDAQVGYGLELYDFEVASGGPDPFGLLLGRFGFGVYFGDSMLRTGEAVVYYDHRHDDFAAGLGVRGIGGGFLGHVGLKAHQYFSAHWGAGLLIEGGSAIVAGLSLKYRHYPAQGQ